MAALSFCSCSLPQIIHKQSNKSTLFLPESSLFTLAELSVKPISISKRHRRGSTTVYATAVFESSGDAKPSSPAKNLREIIQSSGVHQSPCCFDALSAKLVEQAGFRYCITNGFSISAARVGLPDKGLISYGEMFDQGQQITESVSIPVIGDGSHGYGNAMNVKRTVKGYIKAGFAGIIINDQMFPGDIHGKRVVSRDEAVMRIKAAVDARKESGLDIVIVAKTDSRNEISLDEAISRVRAFTDAGADVVSIDSLASKEEMKTFCNVYPLVPKLVNMVETGGKVSILNPIELEEIGFKLVSYPISLIGVSIQAMKDALSAIKSGRMPPPGSMSSLEEIEEILGFKEYHEEEKRYAISSSSGKVSSSVYGNERVDEDGLEQREESVVEVITPEVYIGKRRDSSRNGFSRIWSRSLRIKIIGRDGFEKLDVRIPAGFLEGVTNIVPALGGVNLKQLMDDAADEAGGKLLLDFKDNRGDTIQVFLE